MRFSRSLTAALLACCTIALTGVAQAQTQPTHTQPPATAAAGAEKLKLPAPVPCPGCWRPALNTSWQWQLSSVPTEPFLNVTMYDIDGFNATKATVRRLHDTKAGRKVVCYISAGSYEDWRPDEADFPASVLGDPLDDWEGERWLDIRQYTGALGGIMRARLDMCKAKGFDAVEFDNVDGYTNDNRLRPRRHRPAALQHLARQRGPPPRPVRRPEERRRPDPRPAAVLRLGPQRAVLAVQGMHDTTER